MKEFKLNLHNRKTIWSCMYLLLNCSIFATLMWFRFSLKTTDEILYAVAKNSAILTVINVHIVSIFGFYTYTEDKSLIKPIHILSGKLLLLFSILHTLMHVVRYIQNSTRITTIVYSGSIMLVYLIIMMILSSKRIRKRNFNVFFVSHSVLLVNVIVISFLHSIYFTALPFTLILYKYGKRLLMRFVSISTNVKIHQDFLELDLKFKNSFYNMILTSELKRNKMSNVWLICYNISRFERHPFNVVDFYIKDGFVYIKLLINNQGDWKLKMYEIVKDNINFNLHNHGVYVAIDKVSRNEFYSSLSKPNCLFIARDIMIAPTISFINIMNRHDEYNNMKRHVSILFETSNDSYKNLMLTCLNTINKKALFVDLYLISNIDVDIFLNKNITIYSCKNSRHGYAKLLEKTTGHNNNIMMYCNSREMIRHTLRDVNKLKECIEPKITTLNIV